MLPFVILGIALVALSLPQAALAYKRLRRLHLVHCTATGGDALVRLGTSPRPGARTLPVVDCTEWPKWRDCAQTCAYALPDAHRLPCPKRESDPGIPVTAAPHRA
jgi:hypothetical protein